MWFQSETDQKRRFRFCDHSRVRISRISPWMPLKNSYEFTCACFCAPWEF
jgi:hypothetical protein